ncbi:MAG: histidine kinase, partial [Acidimicrobiales bacterium]
VHVTLALPDGRLATRGARAGAMWWYAVALVLAVVVVVGSHRLAPWALGAGWALATATSLPVAYGRYLGCRAREREVMQALASGVVVAGIAVCVVLGLHNLVTWPRGLAATMVAAATAVPLALLIVALRPAPHADRTLVRLLRALGLVIVVAVVYVATLHGLGRTPATRSERNLLGAATGAAALGALVYWATRGWQERYVTNLIYGAREAPDEVVRSFGSRLTRAIPMDELLLQLVESLRKTLTLATAEIYTGTGDDLSLAASVPDMPVRTITVTSNERAVVARAGASGNSWAAVWTPGVLVERSSGPVRVAPISHAGELLGLIVVARPDGAAAYNAEDDRVLVDLARQVGLALHNARLDTALQSSLDELRHQADELRASRARLVAAGDAERRRVERNLHDGAQQHLVALAVNLRLAKTLVTEDTAAATEMLEELGLAVQETIQELRELAHGIYPPLLVDSGLPEALRAVANRSPLDVELVTEGVGRYGSDVEAAIYFCCLEALQNAAKHAPEAHVDVRVWQDAGALLFEVADNGPGFDVARMGRGHGRINMADRLGAIGGSVRWDSEVGVGTTIRGSVPVDV